MAGRPKAPCWPTRSSGAAWTRPACRRSRPTGWTPSRPRSRSGASLSPPDGSGRGGRTCAPSAGGPSGVPGVDCAIQAFDGLAVCSYHGAWGAFRQRERLDEARLLDARLSRCAAKGAVLLCGDFNAMPDEPAIRLLSGPSEAPTFWTEAQDTAAMLGRGGPYPTVLPGTSAEAAVTARSQGLNPRLVPGRRIDHMFSYGRPGGWTGGVSAEDAGPSDHALLTAETLDRDA